MSSTSIREEELVEWVIQNLPQEVDTTQSQGAQPFDRILSLLDEAAREGLLSRKVKERIMDEYPEPEDRDLFEFYPVVD